MCTLRAGLIVLLFFSSALHVRAQSPTNAVWPLSPSSTITSTVMGPVSAPNQILGPGPVPNMAILNYTSLGQKLNAGTQGWVAGTEDPTRYIQFDVAANTGTALTIQAISFEYGAAAMAGIMESNVRYSTDGWVTNTLLSSSPLQYQQSSMAVFNQTFTAPVPTGQSFSLRILPYATQNQTGPVPLGVVHNGISIRGESTPITTQDCVEPPAGLVGWWTGDNTADDRSSTANQGSFTGSYTSTGKVDQAFSFVQGGPVVSIPDAPSNSFGAGQDLSIDFWMRTTNTGTQVLMSKMLPGQAGFQIYLLDSGMLHVDTRTSGSAGLSDGIMAPQLRDGNWHFISVSIDWQSTTGHRVRIDNGAVSVLDPTSLQNGSIAAATPFLLGGRSDINGSAFEGELDEVELFDRALSDEELEAIYLAGSAGKCKTESPAPGTLIGNKYEDANGDGRYSAGESYLSGVTITVEQNGVIVQPPQVTNANGQVSFSLPPGTYEVRETVPTGYTQTEPVSGFHTVTITAGGTSVVNFGNKPDPIDQECTGIEPPAGMVLWLPGDADTTDLSGFGNHASLQGNTGYAPAKVGNGFSMVGASDFVTVADDPSLDFGPGDHFSIDLWFKTLSQSSIIVLASKTAPVPSEIGWSLFLQNGRLTLHMRDANGFTNYTSSGPTLNDGALHFVAVSVIRTSATGIRMWIDGSDETFDPTSVPGDLSNASDVRLGWTFPADGFRGVIDELELFDRPLTDDEIKGLYTAGADGKCKVDVIGNPCATKVSILPINTGFDHTVDAVYATGGGDAFWTMVADPLNQSPMPAKVINPAPGWPAAQTGSQWIGPYQIVPDQTASGVSQGDLGLGTYTYALEFCVVGETPATRFIFNLAIQVDNVASVWLVDANGVRLQQIGTTISGSGTISNFQVNGSFAAGTYQIQVDVVNNAIPPDFSGLNLTGTISGANLFMRQHDCCNSDGKITGTKYLDENGDGNYDADSPMAGVVIQLVDAAGNVWTDTTDVSGNYYFEVPPGTYTVTELPMDGYVQTGPAGGSYNVTVGPGGIAPNLDFGNQPEPCLTTTVKWYCIPGLGYYAAVTVTNGTNLVIASVSVTSNTPGVSFQMINAPTFPLAPGASVDLHLVSSGLLPGQTAEAVITLNGPRDAFGVAEACCVQNVSIQRPGVLQGPLCQYYVQGSVMMDLTGVPSGSEPDSWTVRATNAANMHMTTQTVEDGLFLFDGLEPGTYTVSVDMPFGWSMVSPLDGAYMISLTEQRPGGMADFQTGFQVTHTATDADVIPDTYALGANYPNPFNPTTSIQYALPQAEYVRLEVFDMLGRPVATLVDSHRSAGTYTVSFNAAGLPSGTYLYRMSSGSFREVRQLVLMK